MQVLLLVIMGLGLLVAVFGGLMVLVAAFRQHVLWGVAYLFVPFASLAFLIVHWGEARKGFLLSIGGLLALVMPVFAMPETRDSFLKEAQDRFATASGIPSASPGAVAQELSAKIQTQRDRIEALEGQFAQTSSQLSQRYQALAATRKALKPGDETAVARFNEEAAVYQQQTAAQRRMHQELNAAREELDGLLVERTKDTANARPASNGPVIMYSTARCPACVSAKQYFAQRGVAYEARDVEQSPAAMEEFRKLGGRGVPLILVGAKKVEGFDSRALDAML